jgi:hypothetical protein
MLIERLAGITIRKSRRSIKVVAYADDVAVFITRPVDFDMVRKALQYEKETETRLDPTKSKALAIGKWPVPVTALGIEICTHTKMLGISFGKSIESTKASWKRIIRAVQTQAPNAYARKLLSSTESAIRATMPTVKNPVCSADTATAPEAHATDNLCLHMVYLEGSHLPSTYHHTPTTKIKRRLGDVGHRGKLQNASPESHVATQ